MNDPDGSVETWQIEFSAGFGALMDDWGQLCEKEELPPKKLMQTQLYARALFKMQIPAIWQLLYESNSNGATRHECTAALPGRAHGPDAP